MTKLYREFRRQVGWYVALGFLPACMATGCGTNDSGFSEPGSTGGQTSIAATTLPATASTGGQASVAQATGGSAPQAETGGSNGNSCPMHLYPGADAGTEALRQFMGEAWCNTACQERLDGYSAADVAPNVATAATYGVSCTTP
jgi:hypothetical protein